jgi:hypothetical protein
MVGVGVSGSGVRVIVFGDSAVAAAVVVDGCIGWNGVEADID